ncbi:putative nepenthesin [Dioscorea sansibarensis]
MFLEKPIILLLFYSLFLLQTQFISISGGLPKIKLIHIYQSPLSPFYNPNITSLERWNSINHRSELRLRQFHFYPQQAIRSPVTKGLNGDYLMSFTIGKPRVNIFASFDTASELIWVYCDPPNFGMFDPFKSSTFTPLPCNNTSCNTFPNFSCVGDNMCSYSYTYFDGSVINGIAGIENLNFLVTEDDERVTLQKTFFGCGQDYTGEFKKDREGVVGLNMGPNSLISQMKSWGGYKFSYCFMDDNHRNLESQMVFGEEAKLIGKPTEITISRDETYLYYLNLEHISVGSKRLNIPPGIFQRQPDGSGGLILDSGTPMTFLKKEGFEILKMKLKEVVKLAVIEREGKLCFKGSQKDLDKGKVPMIKFHFSGGLQVSLAPLSSFMVVNDSVCLTMASTDGISLFGTLAQKNFHIGIDILGSKVYISPSQCGTG